MPQINQPTNQPTKQSKKVPSKGLILVRPKALPKITSSLRQDSNSSGHPPPNRTGQNGRNYFGTEETKNKNKKNKKQGEKNKTKTKNKGKNIIITLRRRKIERPGYVGYVDTTSRATWQKEILGKGSFLKPQRFAQKTI